MEGTSKNNLVIEILSNEAVKNSAPTATRDLKDFDKNRNT